jgi:hypothetical protein
MTVDGERRGDGGAAPGAGPASAADQAVAVAPPSEQGVPPAPSPRTASRDVDLRLARLHLRLGSVDLARAELETAHAAAPLPADSLADLAEARWRGGNLRGAGEAARLAIAAGSTSTVAAVIRIETDAPGARSWTGAGDLPVAGLTPAEVDGIFAGLPRSAAWPPDPAQPRQAVPDSEAGAPAGPRVAPRRVSDAVTEPAVSAPARRMLPEAPSAATSEPSTELDAAADDLAAGLDGAAAIRLAVLIRTLPSTAPAVLELLEGASSPTLLIVRGDALRLLGRGAEAERAWARASAWLGSDRSGGRSAGATADRATAASAAPDEWTDPMIVTPPSEGGPPDALRQASESSSGEATGSGDPTRPADPARPPEDSAPLKRVDPAATARERPRRLEPNSDQEERS